MGYNFLKRLFFCYMALYGLCSVSCRKTIILVGPSGVGKSTIGNCLLNKDASLNSTQNYPFKTQNGANGCTRNGNVAISDDFLIIDTVGFGDPEMSSRDSFRNFQQALRSVNNQVDLVLYVMQEGRFRSEINDFFHIFHDEVFAGKVANNCVLICSKCHRGWLARNRQSSFQIDGLINRCNNKSFEFRLSYEIPADLNSSSVRFLCSKMNQQSRNKSINELLNYLQTTVATTTHLDLSHVQNKAFEKLFVDEIGIKQLNGFISGLFRTNSSPFPGHCWEIKAGGVVLLTGMTIYSTTLLFLPQEMYSQVGNAILQRFYNSITAVQELLPQRTNKLRILAIGGTTTFIAFGANFQLVKQATDQIILCRRKVQNFFSVIFEKIGNFFNRITRMGTSENIETLSIG